MQMHDSANTQNQVEAWQEERLTSKYADGLEQLPCTRTIPMDPEQVREVQAFFGSVNKCSDLIMSMASIELRQVDENSLAGALVVQWKCDDTGVTENLWLNLSTGHIGSGRAVSACKLVGSAATGLND
jgi:ubiquitin carboxyl-terminal hydrolase 5/13